MRRAGNEKEKPLVLIEADDARFRIKSLGQKMQAQSPRQIMQENNIFNLSPKQSVQSQMGFTSNHPQFIPSHLKIAKVYQVNENSKGELKEVVNYSLTNSTENFEIVKKFMSQSDLEQQLSITKLSPQHVLSNSNTNDEVT